MAAADVGPEDSVLEIGPGTGTLTRVLAETAGRVVAVELDDSLFRLLQSDFADAGNVTLIHGNALSVDPCSIFNGSYKLVANIPYYITGPIVRHYLEAACSPSVMVLMVQREVGLRMVARPGDLSLLGISVQWYAKARIIARVPAGAFYPPPKVDSVIIQLTPRELGDRAALTDTFFELAKAGFAMRRKQLLNALSSGLHLERSDVARVLEAAGIAPTRRAESLSLDEWTRLATVRKASGS